MKKHLLLIFALLSVSQFVKSQTNVSGNITTNTTWTKANSPYVLVGNVGVPSAYTLTIEPGVTVQRSDIYQIIINGAIQCDGTVADSIIFIQGDNLGEDSKFFIELQKSKLDKSNFSFVSFHHNGGLTEHIRVGNEDEFTQTNPKNSGTLHLSNCNLSNGYTSTKGYQTTASLSIDSCKIDAGFLIGFYPYSEIINITNTAISNSKVVSDAYNYGISFTNCSITKSSLRLGCCGSNFKILNSTIENSNLSDAGYGIMPTLITNSNFINTPFNNSSTVFVVTNSTFTATDKLYNIDGTEAQYMFIANQLSLKNCEFNHSSPYNINGINLYGGYNIELDTIVHNQFNNLYDAVTVTGFSTIQLDSNNFSTVGRYDIVNHSVKDFSALYDYFQLKQGQTIDDVIFDQNDDLSYGLVTYIPYATDSVVLPLKLISFTGVIEGHKVVLDWQTTNEVNTSQFVIQRKTGIDFTDIGTVSTTNERGITTYTFADKFPIAGTNYYRLKIVDVNGIYTYSSVIPISYTGIAMNLLVYPNPAKSYVIIEHETSTSDAQLRLIDATGKQIKSITVAKGSVQTRLNVAGLSKGIYQIVWKNGTKTENTTLLIQ